MNTDEDVLSLRDVKVGRLTGLRETIEKQTEEGGGGISVLC